MEVIDFFCGAGGFSEGFRQMGFVIREGYDHWRPAIETYKHNFGTNSKVTNILEFEDIQKIEELPDTEIIIGSPPCVSFSSSNKSGKADKSLGIRLTITYLKIVAVKKHKPDSTLKAWFMENVVNSKKYLKKEYSFEDLELSDWAIKHGKNPESIALKLANNTVVLNAADYGSLQARKRVISGEIIEAGRLLVPSPTHSKDGKTLPRHRPIREMKNIFPSPFLNKIDGSVLDPLFNFQIPKDKFTDHFYDTGIYAADAKFSRHWKVNHPYMGKMSFPENEHKPSRTITATRIANSRESIIYKSEINRVGDGEYRLPTVREAATLMGFPITYQFKGSEYTKWRLIGNAVCSSVSRSLAKTVLSYYGENIPNPLIIEKTPKLEGIVDLIKIGEKPFDNPPVKQKGAKCRWHSFKDGNLTVTLSNYRIGEDKKARNRWYTSIQYGTGNGFPSQKVRDNTFTKLEAIIATKREGQEFLKVFNNGFLSKIGSKKELQFLFEQNSKRGLKLNPPDLVEELRMIIEDLGIEDERVIQSSFFKYKNEVPLKQLFALYGINKISTIANNK